jgi:hypothetical protein
MRIIPVAVFAVNPTSPPLPITRKPCRNALTSGDDKGMTRPRQLIVQSLINLKRRYLLVQDVPFHKTFGGNSESS